METETVTVEKPKRYNRRGRALGGLIVVAVGVVLLLKQMHLYIFPTWLFTWPVFLIVLGFFIGARHGFRSGGGWLVLILIGSIFLIRDYFPQYAISDYIWPLAIIFFGLFLIFRPKRHYWDWENMHYKHKQRYWGKHRWEKWEDFSSGAPSTQGVPSAEDFIDAVSIFGGTHKVIVSKNFKGGDVVNIFGGCDLNFTQADFTGTVVLELTQIFGGAKIIVPPDWKIITKMTSVFGGIEDKRPPSLIKENPEKTLIIEGTSIFAGVSLQCY